MHTGYHASLDTSKTVAENYDSKLRTSTRDFRRLSKEQQELYKRTTDSLTPSQHNELHDVADRKESTQYKQVTFLAFVPRMTMIQGC